MKCRIDGETTQQQLIFAMISSEVTTAAK